MSTLTTPPNRKRSKSKGVYEFNFYNDKTLQKSLVCVDDRLPTMSLKADPAAAPGAAAPQCTAQLCFASSQDGEGERARAAAVESSLRPESESV